MAVITVRSPNELRSQATIAARMVHGKSLNACLITCLKRLVAEARRARPDLFPGKSLAELKPVDRILYQLLTDEGRRTVEDLMAETGLPRKTIKPSLARLIAAGHIGTLHQGGETEVARGARRLIYISLAETQ